MVGIDIYDVTGNKLMTEEGQIALQYAYGDGAEESCRLTSEKVSDLMYGVNVDSYFSLTLPWRFNKKNCKACRSIRRKISNY